MSTYSSNLRIELITNGTQAGTWGDTTNGNLAYVLDSAIAGYQTVSVTSSSQALTYTSGPTSTAANNQAIYAMLRFTTTTGGAFNVYAPPNSKAYIIWNNSGYSMTIYNSTVIGNTTAAGTGITVADGKKVVVFSDATNFYTIDAANLTGTLAIANGGTGQTTANAALNALLPSQTGNVNKYLQTDGSNTSWDAISLSTSDITGTLAIANGGTGATTAAGARTNLGLAIGTDVPSPTGTGASGTWAINVSGNAATATNGLTTGNYNSYAPTLTGTGASGTWGINISGNAATATNGLTTGNYNSYAPTLTGTGASGTWNIGILGNAATATSATTATKLSTTTGSAPVYGVRAWVTFDATGTTIGTNITLLSQGNVASVYKNAVGDWTITFTTAMPDAYYSISGMTQLDTSGGAQCGEIGIYRTAGAVAAGSVRIKTNNGAQTSFDPVYVAVMIVR